MLNNPEQFKTVEAALKSMGTIKAFEDENGPILGDRENLTAFEASFDFCNVALGIVIDTKKKTMESSVWGRYQVPGAQRPSEEWVKFFIRTLFEHIGDDGSYGIPMYSFVNNTADFTAVPTAPMPMEAVINDELTEDESDQA